MFYHARVACKAERAKELPRVGFEFDLTHEDLLSKIAIPFVQKKQFFCGGMVINADKVEEVKFSRTAQNSKELAPMIEARRRMHGVLVLSPAQREVVNEGDDVTREVLDEANSKQVVEQVHKEVIAKSDRVFVVHGQIRLP